VFLFLLSFSCHSAWRPPGARPVSVVWSIPRGESHILFCFTIGLAHLETGVDMQTRATRAETGIVVAVMTARGVDRVMACPGQLSHVEK
jgi:hypothetical protein